jgi:hypothetical protein
VLDLVTPVNFVSVADATQPLALDRGVLVAAIDTAYAAGALTVQQQAALYAAVGVTGGTITPATLTTAPDITGEVVPAGDITAAQFAAFNTALAGYVTAAQAAAATADASEAQLLSYASLLNATQLAVVNATLAVNGVASYEGNETIGGINLNGNGTAVILAGLTTLRTALAQGQSSPAARAALVAAQDAQIIDAATAAALEAAAGAANPAPDTIDATEAFNVQVILEPLIAAATVANTLATEALADAIEANNDAVDTAANIVGADPFDASAAVVPNDAVGSDEAAAAATAAQTALTVFTNGPLADALEIQTDLAALKTALAVNTSELNATLLVAAAVAKGTITAGDGTAILTAAGIPGAPVQGNTIDATEKNALDVVITALQVPSNATVAELQAEAVTLTAVRDATAFAAAQALAAANASPTNGFTATADKAVWVLNTANQLAVTTTPGTGYVLAVNDERNVQDLKSDANNSYNFYAARLTVTFKDLTATVDVPNTGFKTTDLQINQAIKDAINNNVVLNKLISAADGPANTLVITSLIDGVMSNANLGVSLTLPALSGIVDVAGAAAAYGTASTPEAVLAAMQTALTAFNTKGDYVDQLAETGAFGGNVEVTGAASVTTSDNTITPGEGNDVIVLGTTVGSDALLSSNDRVVYSGTFGNDTIVHFKAGAATAGGDVLVLSALGGSILGTAFNVNNSINVADETTANDTAAEVAALFTDSATAQTHVYIAVDTTTNIGKVYAVTDAAGGAAGNVTATLAGTIDLADTLWSTLTVDNFA